MDLLRQYTPEFLAAYGEQAIPQVQSVLAKLSYGTCSGTKGFFRSTDAGARWDKIASQYLPNNYIFDNVKDIDGDKTAEGKVYVILGGTSLVYGTCKP
ncbi:MAG: hypothetical protein ACYC3X_29555 [Pirellulaceae bacterium]